MTGRNVYLDKVPYPEARQRLLERLGGWGREAETSATTAARGRVLAEAVFARRSSPHYHAAAMDGLAVLSSETLAATEPTPLVLTPGPTVVPVDTGDALPEGCDAVIMLEDTHRRPDGSWEIIAPARPWQHVRTMGEDMVASELLLPAGHLITPQDIGALLGAGITRIRVVRRPVVAIIPTGDELVAADCEPAAGQIIEYNSYTLGAQVEEWGGEFLRFDPVPDVPERLLAALDAALDRADVVVINAGSSAGRDDYTACTIATRGEVLVHGLATKPGKPTVVGVAGGVPVLGIPGYPVSALLAARLLLKPLLEHFLGHATLPSTVTAELTRPLPSPLGVDEFVRVRLAEVGGRLQATPLPRGAGLITSMVRADGWLVSDRQSEGYPAGARVEIETVVPTSLFGRTLAVIGSHDVVLDLLDDLLRPLEPGSRLTSSHVGSLGGLMALAKNQCHLATSHLLDEGSGRYNDAFVARLLPGERVHIVNLVGREQGLMVQPGNPRGIADLSDLIRPGVTFINRQRGSGTRVLLDYELRQRGINPAAIAGYQREQYTHLAVAATVAGGAADAGLGVRSAARALGLDFIPLAAEQYELVIPARHRQHPLVLRLLQIISGEAFAARVRELGGYSLERTGEERIIGA